MAIVVGIGLSALVFKTAAISAENKHFWVDEKYEIVSLCDDSYVQIVIGDTPQSNKSPLYFLLQKFSLSQLKTFGTDILVNTRALSIASSVLACLLLYIFIYKHLGVLFAVFTVVGLSSQTLFYHYAAESRPYIFWIMLFALMVIATCRMCVRKYEEIDFKDKIFFGCAILGVTLVVALGVIQSVMAIMTCVVFWYFVHKRPKDLKPIVRFALPLLLICVSIQSYYTLQGVQGATSTIIESPFDLISQIKKGDFTLLKMPLRLLFPKPGRDAYLGVYLTNILVLIGMGIPFLRWSGRRNLKKDDLFIFSVTTVVLAQVAVTVAIIGLIALLHYWFAQRLFLYLIVCQVLLTTMGAYFLLQLNKKILRVIVMVSLAVLISFGLFWHAKKCSSLNASKPVISCQPVEGYVRNVLQEKTLYDKKVPYDFLNYATKIDRYLKACGAQEESAAKKIFMWEMPTNEIIVSEHMPSNSRPALMCGRPIYFTP